MYTRPAMKMVGARREGSGMARSYQFTFTTIHRGEELENAVRVSLGRRAPDHGPDWSIRRYSACGLAFAVAFRQRAVVDHAHVRADDRYDAPVLFVPDVEFMVDSTPILGTLIHSRPYVPR